ncbi:uncharacterized protein FIBRA_05213 [Fibroporia radiculosa]|uniref:Peptidyl-prolyl cis-trans isomerase n=1 Tax=Fibroporia radiculosa TaxID=599839 RepID=J4G8T8_9APHY|nr:uncharacterized protein FIBRA_05213 [Fibroporia radiculosa]CCM03093.1 predicted protein [Fibroporia radiculosa]
MMVYSAPFLPESSSSLPGVLGSLRPLSSKGSAIAEPAARDGVAAEPLSPRLPTRRNRSILPCHPPYHPRRHQEIFCEAVPKAAENFLALCAANYYDGCIWHRNIKGFMIQTGDPSGSGKGGQSLWGSPFSDEIRSTLKFNNRGIVAMANSGPDTNKSQFFITYSKQPHLDGKYTIFGKVIDGADSALDAMERTPVTAKNRPLTEIKLTHRALTIPVHRDPSS